MKIEVHSKTECPYCTLAKEYLAVHDIPYSLFVYDDLDARERLYDQLALIGGQRTVPQVILVENDGSRRRIGGYSDLRKSDVVARFRAGTFDAEF